ncbi:hypothetical protein VCRA2118O238_360001 [Vibrio crassostreae]|nr:hypothetical protein VCRA2118O238_360001 [Vibrio crassostreae]
MKNALNLMKSDLQNFIFDIHFSMVVIGLMTIMSLTLYMKQKQDSLLR